MRAHQRKKERIAAALAVAKTARDAIEIIAGNRGVVDKALEFDESLKEALEKTTTRRGFG